MAVSMDLDALCDIDALELQSSLALAKRFYSAAFRGAWDELDDMLAHDLVVHEAESLPFYARFEGKSALRDLYTYMTEFWSEFRSKLLTVTAGKGYIIGLLQVTVRARNSGQPMSMPVAEILRLSDGRINEIYPMYWDTKRVGEFIEADQHGRESTATHLDHENQRSRRGH